MLVDARMGSLFKISKRTGSCGSHCAYKKGSATCQRVHEPQVNPFPECANMHNTTGSLRSETHNRRRSKVKAHPKHTETPKVTTAEQPCSLRSILKNKDERNLSYDHDIIVYSPQHKTVKWADRLEAVSTNSHRQVRSRRRAQNPSALRAAQINDPSREATMRADRPLVKQTRSEGKPKNNTR